jgi:hypothetical protein
MLENRKQDITPELLDSLTTLVAQPQSEQEPALYQRLQKLYQMMLRLSMEKNLSQ